MADEVRDKKWDLIIALIALIPTLLAAVRAGFDMKYAQSQEPKPGPVPATQRRTSTRQFE